MTGKSDVDRNSGPPVGIVLTPEQVRGRRLRNLAIGVLVGLVVVLVYVLTIAKLGGSVANRPL